MIPSIGKAALALGNSLALSIAVKATVIAAMALIGVRLARGSRAALRHALLAAAFAVLLVLPMASILAPPIHIAVPVAAQGQNVTPSFPYSTPPLPVADGSAQHTARETAPSRWPTLSISDVLLALWIIGAAGFLLPVIIGLWQVRSLRRTALPWRCGQSLATQIAAGIGVRRQPEILLHEAVSGPMTCGVLRPAILLSRDAEAWSDEDLGRAIAHELEHVRRADWLTHCLARAACAFYWFHPLVWIAWRKLTLEAERSCDDAVLARSEAPAYADQLVALARRLSTAEKSPLLAMASRSDLTARVNAILDTHQRRGRAGALAVALACAAGIFAASISPVRLIGMPQQSSAQDWEKAAGGKVSFEVTSVKETKSGPPPHTNVPLGPADVYPPNGGLFSATDWALSTYISFAYKLGAVQIESLASQLPKWARAERFDVQARASGNPTKDQMRLMMQSLLADRFKVKMHHETRQLPIYVLALDKPGKTGPQLRPFPDGAPCSTAPAIPPGRGGGSGPPAATIAGGFPSACGAVVGMQPSGPGPLLKQGARNVPIGLIAKRLELLGMLDRPLIDRTGLSGTFDFTFEEALQPDGSTPPNATAEPDDSGPTFSEALKDQLGIRLESTTGPVDMIIVDHIEQPTPN